MIQKIFFVLLALTATTSPCFASTAEQELASFNPKELQALQSGEQIERYKDLGGIWPQITLYQKVAARPDEAAAVYWDQGRHPEYFPGDILASNPRSPKPKNNVVIIDVTLNLGFGFGTDSLVMQHALTRPNNNSHEHQISWVMLVPSKAAESSYGLVRFVDYQGGSLAVYQNYVVPKDSLGILSWVVPLAKKAVRRTVTHLKASIERIKTQNPQLLDRQLKNLNGSL